MMLALTGGGYLNHLNRLRPAAKTTAADICEGQEQIPDCPCGDLLSPSCNFQQLHPKLAAVPEQHDGGGLHDGAGRRVPAGHRRPPRAPLPVPRGLPGKSR